MNGILRKYVDDLRREFSGYDLRSFQKDLLSGLTVCAVALPLALAFGVGSGATAAAGLITAIIGGLVIGALSGASFQISGPTGAMTAILISLVMRFELSGVFAASLLAGIILLFAGIFRLGSFVTLIPSPVISGFTSGIAVIIALGQVNNFFGVSSEGESTAAQLLSYIRLGFRPQLLPVLIGLGCILVMVLWPKKWREKFPDSLLAIVLATAIAIFFRLDVKTVGEIPQTLLPSERLRLSELPIGQISNLVLPAFSIAALAMIESLLCGASGARMKPGDEAFDGDRELIAQGVGNILIPFFGGVPATAAIARTSVAIKSGGVTRLTGILHSVFLLISMFLLAPVMSKIPLAALAGVLMVTAFRMNEWENIHYLTSCKFKGAMLKFFVTMGVTVFFELTTAIFAGICISVVLFVVRISDIDICVTKLDPERLRADIYVPDISVNVAYLTGPVFFPTIKKLERALSPLHSSDALVLSMRGVPLIDTSGVQCLFELCRKLMESDTRVVFAGVQPKVLNYMERAGLSSLVGAEHFFWDSEEAICHVLKSAPKAVK